MNTNTIQTPRCDAVQSGGYDLAYFARTLERELAEAQTQATYFRERLEAWQDANGSMADRFDACLAENAQLRAALVGVLMHVGGHRETDFVQPLPLTWSATVREAKRVLREVQA